MSAKKNISYIIESGYPPPDLEQGFFFYLRGVEKFTKFVNNIGMIFEWKSLYF